MIDESKYDIQTRFFPERLIIHYGGKEMSFDEYIETKIQEHDK